MPNTDAYLDHLARTGQTGPVVDDQTADELAAVIAWTEHHRKRADRG